MAFCLASRAQASQPYPQELRAALDLSYTPGCTLCHSGAGGGAGVVDTPFGKSMVARGLRAATSSADDAGVGQDAGVVIDATLARALEAMRADGVDSDGDGAEDLDELSWHADPNTYDGLKPNPNPAVHYGCRISFRGRTGQGESLVLIALALLVRHRRGAKSPASHEKYRRVSSE